MTLSRKNHSDCNDLLLLLGNVKIGNLKRKNRDHKKVPKQDENAGNLQILLHFKIPILTAWLA